MPWVITDPLNTAALHVTTDPSAPVTAGSQHLWTPVACPVSFKPLPLKASLCKKETTNSINEKATLPSEQRAFSEMIWRKLPSVKDLPGKMCGSYMDGVSTRQVRASQRSRSETGCEVGACKAILFAFFLTIKQ